MKTSPLESLADSSAARWAGAAVLAGAATAAWVRQRAQRAERSHPPAGRLLDIDGVRLHVVERGAGSPVVLIHGNTVTHRDFLASGLVERLARKHRVILFDRPGYGHSSRPRDRLWTPSAQAKLLHAALGQLGVERAVVVGHSMGAMVALAWALDHPHDVQRLVLLGGYYYPTARIDALLTAPVALPVIGDVLRYTVTAISARLLLGGVVRVMFAPQEVPATFLPTLSREMLVRPGQLRANAEDAAFMIPQAKASSARHAELRMPVAILAGADDKVVDPSAHSERLHGELPGSTLAVVHGAGHMVHHAVPDEVVAAIERFELPSVVPAEHAL
jgi:pimeloyl-ACP methyl ester carboxylesterase